MPIDYSKYPPNWKTEIVPQVHMRAKSRCENCGLLHHQDVWSCVIPGVSKKLWFDSYQEYIRHKDMLDDSKTAVKRVVLTVAHLDHDSDNHNVKLDRLRLWCQKCHTSYDAAMKAENRAKAPREEQEQLPL